MAWIMDAEISKKSVVLGGSTSATPESAIPMEAAPNEATR